ncbi:MAG: PLP-dependent cysteine synthase family protein [Planctomycetota bacterium]
MTLTQDRLQHWLDRYPALALIGNTRLFEVRLQDGDVRDATRPPHVFAKAEWTNPGGSIKDRPVMWMLLNALEDGVLTPDRTLLDSSSGNAGIAYAMIGAMLGIKVELVVPGNASRERKERIRAHGATLIETDPMEGYDVALREAHRRHDADPDRYFMPDQYANANNWRAHYTLTAGELLEQMQGNITHFVSGIGTGGTITGVGRRLKEHSAAVRIVAVRPERFPGIEGLKPLDQPEDIVPKILDSSVIDEHVDVSIERAAEHCHLLARQGVFVGQSSGANYFVARRVAAANPGARIAVLFPDLGERYFSTRLWDA